MFFSFFFFFFFFILRCLHWKRNGSLLVKEVALPLPFVFGSAGKTEQTLLSGIVRGKLKASNNTWEVGYYSQNRSMFGSSIYLPKKKKKIGFKFSLWCKFLPTYNILIKFNNIDRSSHLLTGINMLCLIQHIDVYQIIQLNNLEHVL